jgi:chorismate--pyruvate lyase
LKLPRSTRWFLPSQTNHNRIEPRVLAWLEDRGSLTARLKQYCPRRFSVRVLNEQWVRPDPSEARSLGIPRTQVVLLRQVHLLCGEKLCVYARSVIPLTTLKSRHRRLLYLGDRPLGEYLFSQPSLERSRIEWARLGPGTPLYRVAVASREDDRRPVWGRRSLFLIDRKPLLVSEFFLPALFEQVAP